MNFGVMITNGQPRHHPFYWAETTANSIIGLIDIDATSGSEEAIAARKMLAGFRADLAETLEEHHLTVQQHEQALLGRQGDEILKTSLDPEFTKQRTLDAALRAVENVANKYEPFAAHFRKRATKQVVRDVLRSHFGSAMDIERQVHVAGLE